MISTTTLTAPALPALPVMDDAPAAPPAQPAPARILVVDDDSLLREAVALALAGRGYDVVTAPHGAAALALLTVPGSPIPDLIVLDMRMPVMDGWEFIRAYRQLPLLHAPIMAVTATHGSLEEFPPIEAHSILAKPFNLGEMLELVECYTDPSLNVLHRGTVPARS